MNTRFRRIRKFEADHPAYSVWRGMMRNCGHSGRPNARQVKYYVSRGITVCDAWRDFGTFEAWLKDTGWEPRTQASLTRVDKSAGFSPDNCVVLGKGDAQNFRSNLVRVGGRTVRDLTGLGAREGRAWRNMITQRISVHGWSLKDALSIPPLDGSYGCKERFVKAV